MFVCQNFLSTSRLPYFFEINIKLQQCCKIVARWISGFLKGAISLFLAPVRWRHRGGKDLSRVRKRFNGGKDEQKNADFCGKSLRICWRYYIYIDSLEISQSSPQILCKFQSLRFTRIVGKRDSTSKSIKTSECRCYTQAYEKPDATAAGRLSAEVLKRWFPWPFGRQAAKKEFPMASMFETATGEAKQPEVKCTEGSSKQMFAQLLQLPVFFVPFFSPNSIIEATWSNFACRIGSRTNATHVLRNDN